MVWILKVGQEMMKLFTQVSMNTWLKSIKIVREMDSGIRQGGPQEYSMSTWIGELGKTGD